MRTIFSSRCANPDERPPCAGGTRCRLLPAHSVAGSGRSRGRWLAPRPCTRNRSGPVPVDRPDRYYLGRGLIRRLFWGHAWAAFGRMPLTHAVQRLQVELPAVFVATNFIVGRCTASVIASASRKSFFCPLE